jgi:hypothetical protein
MQKGGTIVLHTRNMTIAVIAGMARGLLESQGKDWDIRISSKKIPKFGGYSEGHLFSYLQKHVDIGAIRKDLRDLIGDDGRAFDIGLTLKLDGELITVIYGDSEKPIKILPFKQFPCYVLQEEEK